MRPVKDIEKLIRKINVVPDAKMSQRTLDEILKAQEKAENLTSAQFGPKIWREIMKSSITKIAVAAVLVITAVISIILLDKSATPAWAIEDTIKALENIRAVKLVGKITQWTGDVAEVTIWAIPDANGNQSEYARMDASGQLIVATPKATYRYWPGINRVQVERAGSFKINPWLGKDFFENIKNKSADWSQSSYTGSDNNVTYVVVNCNNSDGSNSWQFIFDVETKLPVSFRQISNIEQSDVKEMEFSQIEYNPELPEGLFDFQIPGGATVIRE